MESHETSDGAVPPMDAHVAADVDATFAPPPFGSDGYLEGGSFEQNLGFGWDLCQAEGSVELVRGTTLASEGTSFIHLTSKMTCSSCTPGSEARFAFWLAAGLPVGRMGLYFDIRSFDTRASSGTIHFVETAGCKTVRTMAEVSLQLLGADADWRTRCIDVDTMEPLMQFGLYVTGESFDIGLDAFRFGPSCRSYAAHLNADKPTDP
jgi:hypothetical protein